MSMRVLVTNDDGIDGPGLRVLVATLVEHGYTPIVVAPDSDYSGAGTSILSRMSPGANTTNRDITFEERTLAEAPGVEAYAVGAAPAMCALLGMRGAFGDPPEACASGINFGLNTGGAVRHSGTVSAALTAAAFGIPAIAVSSEFDFENEDADLRYDTAAQVAVPLLGLMAGTSHHVLNVNVPRCDITELAGVASATVSQVARFRSFVESREAGLLKMGFKMTDDQVEPGSDTALVMAGYAAVSSLTPVSSVDCVDVVTRLAEQAA